jgi:hypothetical protein
VIGFRGFFFFSCHPCNVSFPFLKRFVFTLLGIRMNKNYSAMLKEGQLSNPGIENGDGVRTVLKPWSKIVKQCLRDALVFLLIHLFVQF